MKKERKERQKLLLECKSHENERKFNGFMNEKNCSYAMNDRELIFRVFGII